MRHMQEKYIQDGVVGQGREWLLGGKQPDKTAQR